ncbi:hypothetical protein DIPPA_27172 [Diplonema papillatum]|nr:hypothetical protein DIPPA_27172 [Diplonema papillatum]
MKLIMTSRCDGRVYCSGHSVHCRRVTLGSCEWCSDSIAQAFVENLFCPEFQRGACLFPEGTCRLFHVHDSGGGGGAAK